MKRAVTALALLLLVSNPAWACVRPDGWPKGLRIDPTATARALADAAASIDVVIAERLTDDFEVATTPRAIAEATGNMPGEASDKVSAALRSEWSNDGVRIHYRVVERLKGAGAETFSMNGMKSCCEEPAASKRAPAGGRPNAALKALPFLLGTRDLSEWEGFGACITPVSATLGERYLVFRDTEGRLLTKRISVRFQGRKIIAGGPVYVPISGPDDAWLKVVRGSISATP